MADHLQTGRSRVGWAALLGFLSFVVVLTVFGLARPKVAQMCDVPAQCDANGDVVGTVTNIPGPYPRTFDVYVTDHKPGEGFWVEVPGSRQTVTALSSTVAFGPLDVSQVRSGVNSIRVEQTATNAKSDSFPPCPHNTPTPTSTNTPVPPTTAGTTRRPRRHRQPTRRYHRRPRRCRQPTRRYHRRPRRYRQPTRRYHRRPRRCRQPTRRYHRRPRRCRQPTRRYHRRPRRCRQPTRRYHRRPRRCRQPTRRYHRRPRLYRQPTRRYHRRPRLCRQPTRRYYRRQRRRRHITITLRRRRRRTHRSPRLRHSRRLRRLVSARSCRRRSRDSPRTPQKDSLMPVHPAEAPHQERRSPGLLSSLVGIILLLGGLRMARRSGQE